MTEPPEFGEFNMNIIIGDQRRSLQISTAMSYVLIET